MWKLYCCVSRMIVDCRFYVVTACVVLNVFLLICVSALSSCYVCLLFFMFSLLLLFVCLCVVVIFALFFVFHLIIVICLLLLICIMCVWLSVFVCALLFVMFFVFLRVCSQCVSSSLYCISSPAFRYHDSSSSVVIPFLC